MNTQEFMDLMEVQITLAQVKLAQQEVIAQQGKAMRVADNNGLTCLAERCFNKAEFLNSRGTQYFCESHMIVKVA